MASILLHTCCAPCTIYPLQRLRSHHWDVYGFFYNPHIQPFQEFQKRLETLEQFAAAQELQVIVRPDYDLEGFLREVAFRESRRCLYCYAKRLQAAARMAKKSRFDAFTTTLLYSKLQKHDLIRDIAREAARKYGIPFYEEDFRPGWKRGQEEAQRLGLYRQQYCGCIYSENDRFNRGRRGRSETG
jgi:predicted adenine nucleotide alpha hydrolase (AANH) superfamily ATPase